MLPFTQDELRAAVLNGRVTERAHPTLDLYIYNYSADVQFNNHWDSVTLNCRGLILDGNFNIVARPWRKFFNFGQRDNEIDSLAPVEVTDKLDGSLGILYRERQGVTIVGGSNYSVATRGSFTSEQAQRATLMWKARYAQLEEYIQDITPLVEIIYPENRIVVDYGNMEDLVLLGAVHNLYGYYYGPRTAAGMLAWTGPVAEVFAFDNFVDALGNWPQREGKEGVVIRSGDKMVKLKQIDYLTLHKIVTNLSPKVVWEQLLRGKTVTDICRDIPDEFHEYVNSMAEPMLMQFDKLYEECLDEFNNITEGVGVADRKKFAIEAQKSKHKSAMFRLLDGKPIKDYLWKSVRPKNTDGLSASDITP